MFSLFSQNDNNSADDRGIQSVYEKLIEIDKKENEGDLTKEEATIQRSGFSSAKEYAKVFPLN